MATILYGDVVAYDPLPIDAQEISTQINLVIAGNLSGNLRPLSVVSEVGNPSWPSVREYIDYVVDPVIHTYEDAAHATYAAAFADKIPEGVNPWLSSSGMDFNSFAISSFGFVDEAAAYDGDPTTFAYGTSGPAASSFIYQCNVEPANLYQSNVFGFYLRYRANLKEDWTESSRHVQTGSPLSLYLRHTKYLSPGLRNWAAVTTYFNPPSAEEPTTIIGIVPVSHMFRLEQERDDLESNTEEFQTQIEFAAYQSAFDDLANDLQVYEFFPLTPNEPLLDAIAQTAVRTPATNPSQITVRGYVPLEASHTITDWPGGDLTLDVDRQQYTATETIIDFEQQGPTLGAPASEYETAVALRQRLKRERGLVGYPFRLAERG